MKATNSIVAVLIIAVVIWMVFFVIPTMGVFRSLPNEPPLPETGSALVYFKKSTLMNSLQLDWVATGWSAVGKGVPLLLFGVMLGYIIGEYAGKKSAKDMASKEATLLGEKYAKEAAARELNADKMLREAQAVHSDYPRIKKELAAAQNRIHSLTSGEEFMMQEYRDLRLRKESVEKELEKARAKIKRLVQRDKRRRAKRVDDDLFDV